MGMSWQSTAAVCVLLLLSAVGGHAHPLRRGPPLSPYRAAGRGRSAAAATENKKAYVDQCKVYYRNATLDHFSWATPPEGVVSFSQRYFLCDEHWRKDGPLFFYVGNEADVTLYLNASGLMWESAEEFGALLVFAEHRYYGESKPYGSKRLREHMQFLTSEQAMADYAELTMALKSELKAERSAVIGFGGSYGGMLASWMRLKYPHILDGAIAGSAPIWSYLGEHPPYDPGSYAKIVTRDASPAAGAAAACVPNMRNAWQALFAAGGTEEGRAAASSAMRLCPHAALNSSADAAALADWLSSAWDYLAMGNYPYPSTYILNGGGELPPYPVREACKYLAEPDLHGNDLLAGLALAAGVFYNFSGQNLECFDWSSGPNEESEDTDFWGYQWCTEQFQPFSRDGVHDMYWDQPFDLKGSVEGCQQQWGVTPRPMWATIEWGGKRLDTASNIVFTNGLLDPWHGGGVLRNLSDSVVVVLIPEGAHHLDLMFSHPLDPDSVKAARDTQRTHMRAWVAEVARRTDRLSVGATSVGAS